MKGSKLDTQSSKFSNASSIFDTHLTKDMKNLSFLLIASIAVACSPSKSDGEKTNSDVKKPEPAITLTKAPASPQFPDAKLTKTGVDITANDSSNTVAYSFDVTGYELGVQTEDSETRGIANSGKGQHIHFIVNNGPYSAHYMPGVSDQLADGNYVVLAFLSRSYHESVKSPEAFHIENLNVGGADVLEADLSAPHLFYSRPKGTYKGADTKKLMLDFYLANMTISPEGNKVRATINGTEFMIDEWAPYYIEGLTMGEVKIKLELIDSEGNAIEGPFNNVERIVTLAE